MKRAIFVFVVAVMCSGASKADWKLFDYNTFEGTKTYSFYEANSIKRLPNGHVQVWTKGLPAPEVDGTSLSKEQVDDAGSRLLKGYKPPSTKIFPGQDNAAAMAGITAFEEVADDASIEPVQQFLWEFDCTGDVGRTLSTILKDKNSNVPSGWVHLPPQSTGENLLTLVCP